MRLASCECISSYTNIIAPTHFSWVTSYSRTRYVCRSDRKRIFRFGVDLFLFSSRRHIFDLKQKWKDVENIFAIGWKLNYHQIAFRCWRECVTTKYHHTECVFFFSRVECVVHSCWLWTRVIGWRLKKRKVLDNKVMNAIYHECLATKIFCLGFPCDWFLHNILLDFFRARSRTV